MDEIPFIIVLRSAAEFWGWMMIKAAFFIGAFEVIGMVCKWSCHTGISAFANLPDANINLLPCPEMGNRNAHFQRSPSPSSILKT